jgi:glycosyltransferase involved in cell wall biosynthesis
MPKLAILNTHPIQYYSPYYRRLAEREELDIHVFYSWRGSVDEAYDPGFEQDVSWDIPLLDGYDYTFLENPASDPGTHHFRGIVAPDLTDTIERWGPDAILIFGWNYQAHLRALRYFHGRIPVLFRGDSTLLDDSWGPKTWMRRLWLRWVYRHVDVALYVGQNNRSYFKAHGVREEELIWVPHAVENERFAESDEANQEASEWKQKLGISSDDSVVLFAGKFEEKKAPDTLLDAFLRPERSNVHLVMAGSGPLETKLRGRAEENPRVHFLGFQNQSQMPVVYRLGDLFVLPSRGPGETWGLAVNEAMACGRPVVVTEKVGCAPDLVDKTNGATVSPDDTEELSDTLETLLRDEERLVQMGRQSRERITRWTIETAAKQTEQVIQEVP